VSECEGLYKSGSQLSYGGSKHPLRCFEPRQFTTGQTLFFVTLGNTNSGVG
jgi:hypothetical protein